MPKDYTTEFARFAHELDLSRQQETKMVHLWARAARCMLQSSRNVVDALNNGALDAYPDFDTWIRVWKNKRIEGTKGTLAHDGKRFHLNLYLPPMPGGIIPIETISDEGAARIWVFVIMPLLRKHLPTAFKANAGTFDGAWYLMDEDGNLITREGKRIQLVKKSESFDPNGRLQAGEWRLSDEPVILQTSFDEHDWFAHVRNQVADWADACRAMAELLSSVPKSTGIYLLGTEESSDCSLLTVDDLAILRALCTSTVPLSQFDIAEKAKLSRGTVGTRLKQLRKVGLTNRPHGQRRGESITPQGKSLVSEASKNKAKN